MIVDPKNQTNKSLLNPNNTKDKTDDIYIATPPKSAVGFLCHLSLFGVATIPYFKASVLTKGVILIAKKNGIKNE